VITDANRAIALSNLGWVDRGVLWLYELEQPDAARHVRISYASHLRLFEGDGETFAGGSIGSTRRPTTAVISSSSRYFTSATRVTCSLSTIVGPRGVIRVTYR
jgi:hypothetical protein